MAANMLFTRQVMKIVKRIYDIFIEGLVYTSVCLILFMVLCISASVLLRHTQYSYGWQLEASEYILIVITFFASGWLLRTGGHIRVDIIPNFIKGRKRDYYDGMIFTLVAVLCLGFTISGASTAWEALIAGTLQIKVYTFPKWILISLIPFGVFFLFIESVKLAYRYFAGKTILIVDDEVDVIDSLQELLQDYRIDKAIDYDEASEKLKGNAYDAVILDIMGVQGLDLLKMAVKKDLPTIMLTAHAFNEHSLKESMIRGAISFVPKEMMMDMHLYVDDAMKMRKEDARANFYKRLGAFFDYRFGPDWDRNEEFWADARRLLSPKV
jgi:TRAP-type C4-dicarboxylate transport system permease small subunit